MKILSHTGTKWLFYVVFNVLRQMLIDQTCLYNFHNDLIQYLVKCMGHLIAIIGFCWTLNYLIFVKIIKLLIYIAISLKMKIICPNMFGEMLCWVLILLFGISWEPPISQNIGNSWTICYQPHIIGPQP